MGITLPGRSTSTFDLFLILASHARFIVGTQHKFPICFLTFKKRRNLDNMLAEKQQGNNASATRLQKGVRSKEERRGMERGRGGGGKIGEAALITSLPASSDFTDAG